VQSGGMAYQPQGEHLAFEEKPKEAIDLPFITP
jgi:hypothetical protein